MTGLQLNHSGTILVLLLKNIWKTEITISPFPAIPFSYSVNRRTRRASWAMASMHPYNWILPGIRHPVVSHNRPMFLIQMKFLKLLYVAHRTERIKTKRRKKNKEKTNNLIDFIGPAENWISGSSTVWINTLKYQKCVCSTCSKTSQNYVCVYQAYKLQEDTEREMILIKMTSYSQTHHLNTFLQMSIKFYFKIRENKW